jgi:hypothetical protein
MKLREIHLLVVVLVGAGGCFFIERDLTGHACDPEGRCLDGFVCINDVCVADGPGGEGEGEGSPGEGEGEGEGEGSPSLGDCNQLTGQFCLGGQVCSALAGPGICLQTCNESADCDDCEAVKGSPCQCISNGCQ